MAPPPPPLILADFVPRRRAPRGARASLARTASQDVIEDAAAADPSAPAGVQSANERVERWGDGEVCGNGCRWLQSLRRHLFHAIFFALAAEMFPGEMRGACVDLFV